MKVVARTISIIVATIAVLLSIVSKNTTNFARYLDLYTTTTTSSSSSSSIIVDNEKLYWNKEYIYGTLRSPSVSSPFALSLLARIYISSPLGDFIARALLNKNKVSKLAELAHAIQESHPINNNNNNGNNKNNNDDFASGREFGLGEPLIRLSTADYLWHVEAAAEEDQQKYLSSTTTSTTTSSTTTMATKKTKKYNSIRDFHDAYMQGSTTPTIVLEKLLTFIEKTDAQLRCIQEIDYVVARKAAAESTERYAAAAAAAADGDTETTISLWDGIPVLIKPEIAVKGLHHTLGRQMNPSMIASFDDIIVTRFRTVGAIVVGYTVMHEQGIQPTGYNSWYQGPKNPYDLSRFSGGSSAGSAVAVATGMVPVATAQDGGGSVRIPAAWSGVVGLATGYSRIPYTKSAVNLAAMSKSGPITNNVIDAGEALLLLGKPITEVEYPDRETHPYHALYGGDGPPPTHLKPRWFVENGNRHDHDHDNNNNTEKKKKPIVRIGVFSEWVSDRPSGTGSGVTAKDDAVYKAYEKMLHGLLHSRTNDDSNAPELLYNYERVNFTIPHMKTLGLAHSMIISTLFTFGMAKELFEGTSTFFDDAKKLELATSIQIKLGATVSALEYVSACRLRSFALAQFRSILRKKKVDIILTPTIPMTALTRPAGNDKSGYTDASLFVQMLTFAWPSNLAGMPAIAIPTGTDSAGLPISMQVICLHWHEADCLAIGKEIETLFARENSQLRPPSNLFIDLLAP